MQRFRNFFEAGMEKGFDSHVRWDGWNGVDRMSAGSILSDDWNGNIYGAPFYVSRSSLGRSVSNLKKDTEKKDDSCHNTFCLRSCYAGASENRAGERGQCFAGSAVQPYI